MKFLLGILAIILLTLSLLFLTGTGPFTREEFTDNSVSEQNKQLFIFVGIVMIVVLISTPLLIKFFKIK